MTLKTNCRKQLFIYMFVFRWSVFFLQMNFWSLFEIKNEWGKKTMEKILMKGLENNNMTLNNHKRYRYGAEFYNFISFRNADLFYFGCQYQCLYIKSHFPLWHHLYTLFRFSYSLALSIITLRNLQVLI